MELHANTGAGSLFREVLSIRTFRRLWLGQLATQLAQGTMLFVLALRVYQTTGSNTAVSGLFLSYGIPALLFGMAAGSVVDRLDKRFVLVVCDIGRALLAGVLIFFSQYVVVVYVVTFLNAVITQFYVPSEASMIPQVVPEKRLLTANSMFSFTYYSSLALGSVLSGPVLRLLTPQGVFILIVILFIGAGLNDLALPATSRMSYELRWIVHLPVLKVLVRITQSVADGIAYVSQSRVLADALLLLTGTQILLSLLATLGPGFADQVLHIDVRDASVVLVGPAIAGIILGALWIGQRGTKIPPNTLTKRGIIAAGTILILIALNVYIGNAVIPSAISRFVIIPVSLLLFFFLGIANSMLDVPSNSILQQEAEGPLRGRVYGLLTAAVGGGGILPVVLGGVLADVLGTGTIIFLLGIVVLSYGVWRLRYNA